MRIILFLATFCCTLSVSAFQCPTIKDIQDLANFESPYDLQNNNVKFERVYPSTKGKYAYEIYGTYRKEYSDNVVHPFGDGAVLLIKEFIATTGTPQKVRISAQEALDAVNKSLKEGKLQFKSWYYSNADYNIQPVCIYNLKTFWGNLNNTPYDAELEVSVYQCQGGKPCS